MLIETRTALVAATLLLTACSGGGGGGGGPAGGNNPDGGDIGLFGDGNGTSSLRGHAIATGSRAVTTLHGSIDHASGAVSYGGEDATLSQDRLTGRWQDGGQFTFTQIAGDFAATYLSEPALGLPSSGVVGVATPADDVPGSGTVTYDGQALMQIIDSDGVYDLTGDARVTAEFGEGRARVLFSGLAGVHSSGLAAPQSVENAATLAVDSMTISGAGYSGGVATLSSDRLSTGLSGSQAMTAAGSFFGPNAVETGGAVAIDDTASGTLLIQGTYLAD